ncbi:MAG TPA: TraB/GumN family protein [Kofleriaceae bacterium]|nr:TraB/GumN family protein [Kofleriaceae bacterium]
MKRSFAVFALLVSVFGAGISTSACKSGHESSNEPTTASLPPLDPAPAPGSSIDAPPPKDPLPHPLFWSVEKDGKTTYVLGTMHIGIDADNRLPLYVWRRFHAASTFAMEADLDDAAAVDALKPTPASLRAQLGDDYWKKLETAVGPGMAKAFDHMPTMVPAAALSIRGLPMTDPMDKTLAAHASSEHKRIVFLEPAARQIALLLKWMDVKALKMMLDDTDSEAHAKATLDAYVTGDEARFLQISDGERAEALRHGYTAIEYDQEMKDLLYDRNASWIDEIERVHGAGGGFIAVGALHLLGPHSVLELLRARGYTITRLTS